MPRIVARILLSILLMPLGAVLYVIAYILLEQLTGWRSSRGALLAAGGVVWLIVGAAWVWIWFASVLWTRRRTGLTIGAVVLSGMFGALASLAVTLLVREREFGIFTGSAGAILLWLASTVLIWRETRGETAERLRRHGAATVLCPSCGYNMTGLKATTCPECGEAPPLEELIARQPARGAAELGPE